ncbi:MAG TPA: DUF2851 family protein [Chthoniobacterales bacterium]
MSAERYGLWLEAVSRVGERSLFPMPPVVSELELQARWFAGDFPRCLETTDGQRVEIVQYGVWNREPGPDFVQAVVRIGDGEPRLGAVEIDVDRRDWERHGHATNPNFENVVLHLFVEPGGGESFTRTPSHRLIPQVRLPVDQIAGETPFPPLARVGRCSAPLAELSREKIADLLSAAASFRLEQKAQHFARVSALHGRDEALFQGIARALGYKENRLPFELLAQRCSLERLRKSGDDAEAVLFGCAGFLNQADWAGFDGGAKNWLRLLWDRWWSHRTEWEHVVLPRAIWRFFGARPQNHPQRRLAALAEVVKNWKNVGPVFHAPSLKKLEAIFERFTHSFWENHYTLTSTTSAEPMALVGLSRVIEIYVNVAVPLAWTDDLEALGPLKSLRQPLMNRRLETAAARLFGGNPLRKEFMPFALYQQGLLQIYEDFCLRDMTDCEHCPFPEKVRMW